MRFTLMYSYYTKLRMDCITKWILFLFVEYSIATNITNYQKLFLNIAYTNHGIKNLTHCRTGQIFPNHIESINIFKELAKTEPCYCVLHHRKVSSKFIWKYRYYLHNSTSEQFLPDTRIRFEGCGPFYFSVINNMVTFQYTGVSGAVNVVQDLPLRILTAKEIGQVMLLCQNHTFSHDLTSCDRLVTSTSSQFTDHDTSTNMLMRISNESQLKIIIPAVLIPIFIILLVCIVIIVYKKRQKDMDNSAIVSDTIEVRQAKGKNTHLKIHNYENVERPTVLEIVEQSSNVTAMNHNYENVYKQQNKKETEKNENGSIYSIVPPSKMYKK